MAKKIRFNDLSIGLQLVIAFIFFIVGCVLISSIAITIFEEPKRNAYWECHNETFEGIVNKTQVGFCYYGDLKIWSCNYEGYTAKCPYDSDLCFIDDEKEVCEIV